MRESFIGGKDTCEGKNDIEIECFSSLYDDIEERVIFFDGITSCFYTLDVLTGELEVIAATDDEYKWAHYGTGSCVNEHEYCFPPCNSDDLIVIRDKNIVKKIHINYGEDHGWKFCSSFCVKDYVLLIPEMCDVIIRIDLNNETQTCIDDWCDEYKKQTRMISGGPRRSRYGTFLIEGSRIFIPLLWSRYLMTLDTNTWKTSFFDTGVDNARGYLAAYNSTNGRNKYLVSKESNLIVVMDEWENVMQYKVEMKNDTFGRSVLCDNKILLFGMHSYQVAIFDVDNKVSKLFDLDKNKEKRKESYNLSFSSVLKLSEKDVIAFDINDHCIYQISSKDCWETIEMKKVRLHYAKHNKNLLLNKVLKSSGFVKETHELSLNDFLSYVGGGRNDR